MLKKKSNIIHPGELLREEFVKANRLFITEAADLIGISRVSMSNILDEKSDITPEIAIRISMVFGGSAEEWVRMQLDYDMQKAYEKLKGLKLKTFKPKKPGQKYLDYL